jgi:hypothetical protein
MDKDISKLVNELRKGNIDASEFSDQLDEVVDEAAKTARESEDPGSTKSERIDSAARKASRL